MLRLRWVYLHSCSFIDLVQQRTHHVLPIIREFNDLKTFLKDSFPVALFLASIPSEQFSEQKARVFLSTIIIQPIYALEFGDIPTGESMTMTFQWWLEWASRNPPTFLVHAHFHPLSRRLSIWLHWETFAAQSFFVPSKSNNSNKKLLPTIWWDSIVSQASFTLPPSLCEWNER